MRIVVIQGSARNEKNCPDQDGKTRYLTDHVMAHSPAGVELDFIDLSVTPKGPPVAFCKACVSTAGGYHCHWPCSCYGPKAINLGARKIPDLMHAQKVYDRLQKADGFILFSPVNWYDVPSQVKAFFDRLVCASLALTRNDAVKLGLNKNATKTRAAYKEGRYDHLLKNRLEGRVAAFFIHGDNGADDYTRASVPPALNLAEEKLNGRMPSEAVHGIVDTCRYMGIWVPDDLVLGLVYGEGTGYPENHDRAVEHHDFFQKAESLMQRLIEVIKEKRS